MSECHTHTHAHTHTHTHTCPISSRGGHHIPPPLRLIPPECSGASYIPGRDEGREYQREGSESGRKREPPKVMHRINRPGQISDLQSCRPKASILP